VPILVTILPNHSNSSTTTLANARAGLQLEIEHEKRKKGEKKLEKSATKCLGLQKNYFLCHLNYRP
jgi:hypothetical protein